MKKKILSMVLVGFMSLSMVACGGGGESGVSQEEYDKVVKERDQYKAELEETNEEKAVSTNENNSAEKVDLINIDTSEISLKYTNYEIKENTDYDGNTKKQLVVYFDFTNKMKEPMSSGSGFSSKAFQGGIELRASGGADFLNDMTKIKDGATINVGFLFDLNDTETPVEIEISSGIQFKGTENFVQQQEIVLE